MKKKLQISFPHLGNYYIPIERLLKAIFPGHTILPPPPITVRTLELGSRYSPDFVCAPFKFNLGNYLEALEKGANLLLQTGTGCRFGYYGELQEQILRDLGWDFQFICFSRQEARPWLVYQTLHRLGSPLNPAQFLYQLGLTLAAIRLLDQLEYFLRYNIGFQTEPGSGEKLHQELLMALKKVDSFGQLRQIKSHFTKAFYNLPLKRPEKYYRVGLVGDLYTLMEPFSNFYLEKELANKGIAVSRIMNISFLLFGKNTKKSLLSSADYLKYNPGANGADSVAQSHFYAAKGFDGVIHIKSFGCVPELNATPSLQSLSRDWKMPILHLSFDSHTSEAGIQTRLEAFTDMIELRRQRTEDGRQSGLGFAPQNIEAKTNYPNP
ncbi:MAG: hypothetical protein LBB91_07365 [Clostridiales bacterium]|jgi:predicted nucleotide-binding protein (sugar kinase/HSP70/actin superfamily)|nr:hypothetical protein [Clostridiales bacterium]